MSNIETDAKMYYYTYVHVSVFAYFTSRGITFVHHDMDMAT